MNLIKEESIRNLALKCFNERSNEEDLIFSFFQIALPSPRSSCNNNASGSEEGIFISEEDFDGYDLSTDICKEFDLCALPSNGDFQSQALNGDAHPKPAIIRKLTCLFGALKVSASCEPPSSSVTEIRAC